MDQFSISQLAKYSGIKAHTIRAWEKRYNALEPLRTGGNTRYYNGTHLKRLLNLSLLKEEEKNLAVLCKYSNEELAEKVKDLFVTKIHASESEELFISRFIVAGVNFDEALFNKTYASVMWSFSTGEAYQKIILPVLQRVGLLWSSEEINVPMEHFISEMFRRKIYASIDKLGVPENKETGGWVLFLREGEFHELGLLMANLILREHNKTVLYLGANTPADQVEIVLKSGRYDHLLFFERYHNAVADVKKFLKGFAKKSSLKIYIAGGADLSKLGNEKNVTRLTSVNDLLLTLK